MFYAKDKGFYSAKPIWIPTNIVAFDIEISFFDEQNKQTMFIIDLSPETMTAKVCKIKLMIHA